MKALGAPVVALLDPRAGDAPPTSSRATRRITQLIPTGIQAKRGQEELVTVYALADDGSCWAYYESGGYNASHWVRLTDLPQP